MTLTIILWAVAIITIIHFLKRYLFPYIATQFALWTVKRMINKIAKKHKGSEVGNQLNKITSDVKEIMREEKL